MEVRARRAGDAVRRPGLPVVGVVGEVRAGIDVEVLGGDDVGVIGVGAASSSVMPRATAAPPATAREPPSQKSFWTSTMISARIVVTYR